MLLAWSEVSIKLFLQSGGHSSLRRKVDDESPVFFLPMVRGDHLRDRHENDPEIDNCLNGSDSWRKSWFVLLEMSLFNPVLLRVERQAQGFLNDVGGEGHVGGDLGDLAADEGAAFPDFRIAARPVDF